MNEKINCHKLGYDCYDTISAKVFKILSLVTE